jgi:hypothetical protein
MYQIEEANVLVQMGLYSARPCVDRSYVASGCWTMCVSIAIFFLLVLFSCGTLLKRPIYLRLIFIFYRLINHKS